MRVTGCGFSGSPGWMVKVQLMIYPSLARDGACKIGHLFPVPAQSVRCYTQDCALLPFPCSSLKSSLRARKDVHSSNGHSAIFCLFSTGATSSLILFDFGCSYQFIHRVDLFSFSTYLTFPAIRNAGDIRSHIYDPTLIGEVMSESLKKNQNGRCFNRGKQGHLKRDCRDWRDGSEI